MRRPQIALTTWARIRVASTLVIAMCLTACANSNSSPTPMTTTTPAPTPFRIIAYITDGYPVPAQIPYAQLTHINYAFITPNADGTFNDLANKWKLKQIVTDAHTHGVKVLISVGGWGWDEQFETLAADTATRAKFVAALAEYVTRNNLDGLDMDWEYPGPGAESAQNFVRLMLETRAALPTGSLLTAAVVSYGENGDTVLAESFGTMDFLNLMAYDGPDHGTMEQATAALDYWNQRGLSPEKMVLGVPFYTRPGEVPYRKLVTEHPEAAQVSEFDYAGRLQHYNGLPAITEKTQLALRRASGVMFWTLDHDATNEYSLLKQIYLTAHGQIP